MQKTCPHCGNTFNISAEDLAFYKDISPAFGGKTYPMPPPTLCPDCRHQRRLAFRNERRLYSRHCDLCKQSIVSVYSPGKPLTVYCHECFWSDTWDPCSFGRAIDFRTSFFDQFAALLRSVPLLSNIAFNSVNSDYNVFCVDSKNCYLSTRVVGEEIYYSYLALNSLWCVDCYDVFGCQYCYECVDCWTCYTTRYSRLCRNCSDCSFCFDCIGCRHCIGCVGMRNTEYALFNKKCSKEEYEEYLRSHPTDSLQKTAETQKRFVETVLLPHPVRALIIDQSENAQGNYISRSKNIRDCFDVEETDTAAHSWGVEYSKDIVDGEFIYKAERCYEQISNNQSVNIFHSFGAYNSHDLRYCMQCFNSSHDCFGCVSLKQKQYCILNKQYSKEDYERLVPQLIEHMQKTDEWGEFFPASISTFGYNESVAQEFFPLTKEEALQKGFQWSSEEVPAPAVKRTIKAAQLPDTTSEVPDDILHWAIECEITGKPFRIIRQELDFYRKQSLPLPRKHPDERHQARFALRNPRKLWPRQCMKCQKEIETTYAPERSEIVYCEECYREIIY